MTTGTHRDLRAWQEAMELTVAVYEKTAEFPRDERYGLTSQMRRSARSVPSLIAEGAARNSTREMYQYLGWATGSLAELETDFELAIRLRYLEQNVAVFQQARRVGRLVNALRNSYGRKLGEE
jgi:four helix bundle protein